jgi:hypothetical protein
VVKLFLQSNMLMAYCFTSCLILHLMHCIIFLLVHIWLIYLLGHMYAEPELEEPTEQAQAKDLSNIAWIKASPGAFTNSPCLLFVYALRL